MLISLDWLGAFVAHGRTTEELHDLISAHVATVDRVERLRADLEPIVVARVVEAGRHPNSDRLWVTKVDAGNGELLDVVCGAPNVAVGTLYPFARTGTTLPDGRTIEKRKIRGETSNGMLCSAAELGLGADHDGILALDIDVAPGTPFLDALPIGDVRFDVDVLPNRPDLLSHLGLAREVAAIAATEVRDPAEVSGDAAAIDALAADVERHATTATSGGVTIRLEDTQGCPRYMGIVIRDVSVGPSPDWLVQRLRSVGLRSINNVVDVTNYMLHGYGQPMHAFDLGRLADATVVIRKARAGERLVTLDGVDRPLSDRMTVIADAERPVAVAGVMGGHDSEVGEQTKDVFLEVAYFSAGDTRLTRRHLGLSTDASYRFERGIDPEGTPRALAVAARLLTAVAGGRVDGRAIDVGAAPPRVAPVMLRPSRVRTLLGDDVATDEIARLLRGVGFVVTPSDERGALRIDSPSWRRDVSREADMVEEIARLRGYDTLPDELRAFRPGTVPDHSLHVVSERVREVLTRYGVAETRPLPFVRGTDETHIRVRNPLGEDEPHLRRTLLETLARRAEYNLSRSIGNVRLFEVGSAFQKRNRPLPAEELRVAALLMGARRPPHFTEPRPPAFDAWDAKYLAEEILRVGRPGEAIEWRAGTGTVFWTLHADGAMIGEVCEVVLDRPVWAAPAYGVEITLGPLPNENVAPPGERLTEAPVRRVPEYPSLRPLPTTPAAVFDLALLLPANLTALEVERVIRGAAGELLEQLDVFDEYRGEGLPSGYRSVAWTLTLRDPVRTLRDKEIEGRRQKILRALEGELGVKARSS